ncbi:hypothetical protein [Spirosoma pollinicola]|uniref:Uncharacterized protein n=1 Tax=Spirosoma pollinicola TaxID=2057025 RepID=A0A2K8YXA9_9BACT|nr:hypothetical protein [Spirosoma pollinicola]AUD02178.1 hypothetical protein CWM47_10305 [Spirosoma pollinicola]
MSYTGDKSNVEQEFQQLKTFVSNLFPASKNLVLKVTRERQQQELDTLRIGRRPEQFFFIVDFINLSIVEAVGLEEIGFNSERFSFRQYLATIPGGSMRQFITLLGKQTFILSHQAILSFLKPQFVANVPITCADGRVLLTKRTISPWQISESGLITAYLSEFIILKTYEDEPINPRFVHLDPAIEMALNRMASRTFATLPKQNNLFTPKEIILIKLYAETSEANVNANVLAKQAEIALSTLHSYNKSILMKAKEMFGEALPTKTARDVAIYLKKCGLLG